MSDARQAVAPSGFDVAAQLAGHDPADYGAHSLRAGLATTAAEAGVSLGESMQATQHASATVAATWAFTSPWG